MTKPTIRIHNAETDEVIDREMTNAEFAQYKIDKINAEARAVKAQERIDARAAAQAKLEALGLTVEDLQALGL
jgi:hypothetical protein